MTEFYTPDKRRLSPEHILSLDDYQSVRRDRRRYICEVKRLRRLEVGPIATFHFENFETMRHQVQEMLFIEKGGDAQLADELAAYNPLIPQGTELSATVMFEIDDPVRRAAMLARLGGIENHIFIDVAGIKICGVPDATRENTGAGAKASAVQFVKFPFAPAEISRFKTPGTAIIAGFDHPNYSHMATLSEAMRAILAQDFD